MGSIFEACKKDEGDNENGENDSYVSDEIINIISNKKEINHTKYIANILNANDDDKEYEISRRRSWLRKVNDP